MSQDTVTYGFNSPVQSLYLEGFRAPLEIRAAQHITEWIYGSRPQNLPEDARPSGVSERLPVGHEYVLEEVTIYPLRPEHLVTLFGALREGDKVVFDGLREPPVVPGATIPTRGGKTLRGAVRALSEGNVIYRSREFPTAEDVRMWWFPETPADVFTPADLLPDFIQTDLGFGGRTQMQWHPRVSPWREP